MVINGEQMQSADSGTDLSSSTNCQNSEKLLTLYNDTDKEEKGAVCRVCQCTESDSRGEAALGFLNIIPPFQETSENGDTNDNTLSKADEKNASDEKGRREPGFVEFISPDGDIFVCSTDVETGSYYQHDILIDLGCSCKGDLSLVHYACALKWFVSHGSAICEICGSEARNVRLEDIKKVLASLKDYESLWEKTATGELTHAHPETNTGVDPDAVAAIRRQRLSEISLWFNPRNNFASVSHDGMDQLVVIPPENSAPSESLTTKWAVEGTGILVATGLLTVTLAWLIAPRVGKKTARNGLHILLGGICALTVVIFLRFIVLSRIKYGPARYWAILFVFWFLVFGIWASRTHGAHTT